MNSLDRLTDLLAERSMSLFSPAKEKGKALLLRYVEGYQALSFQAMAASNPGIQCAYGRKCSK